MMLHLFDLILLLVFVVFLVRGLLSGMISQVVSVGSFILCWVVSTRFSFVIAPMIPAQEPWNGIGAMIILFIVTMIVIRFAHSVVNKLLVRFRLVKYDRFLGLLLGGLKGVFLCMVITFFAAMLSTASRQAVLESRFGNIISQLIVRVGCFIPSESGKMLKTQIELFNEQVDGKFTNADDSELQLPEISFDAVLENVQDIKNKIEDKIESSQKATSLIDGIVKWWNGNKTTSEIESESTPKDSSTETNNSNNNITANQNTNPFLESLFPLAANNTDPEKQPQTKESATRSAPTLTSSIQEITGQIPTESDSDQFLIPQDRGLFRLPRSPIQPSEFNRSQTTTKTNSPAKLFGQ